MEQTEVPFQNSCKAMVTAKRATTAAKGKGGCRTDGKKAEQM